MNKSEGKGYKWLLKQGYKEGDIVFQRKGIDFICADGKGYEVKRLYGHVIWFHEGQLERTKGEFNSVLVFDDDLEEPVAVLASNELEKDKVLLGIKITVVNGKRGFGFGVMSIKREVIVEIQERTKASGLKSSSAFLSRLLKEEKDYEADLSNAIKDFGKDTLTEIRGLKEALKDTPATDSLTQKESPAWLSNKDVKRIAAEMLLEIGMHIENGVAKGVKELR